jgi:dinuclear metal center YbgI/SA1388 family protein
MGYTFSKKGTVMSIGQKELKSFLNSYLNIYDYSDYGPNGLQIEGKQEIKKIAYAVSATKYSVKKAVELGADALIVHHGLFWKFHGPKTITGAFAHRVKPLILNDINLFGYHLPLDAHLECGNAAGVARRIELEELEPFGDYKGCPTGVKGKLKNKLSVSEFKQTLESVLNHQVIVSSEDDNASISRVGIITGGANSDWVLAQRAGLDAYITGEISEHDWHEAKEGGVHYFAGGHNATEQFGIQDLMKVLYDKFSDKGLEHFYIPSENPA